MRKYLPLQISIDAHYKKTAVEKKIVDLTSFCHPATRIYM